MDVAGGKRPDELSAPETLSPVERPALGRPGVELLDEPGWLEASLERLERLAAERGA